VKSIFALAGAAITACNLLFGAASASPAMTVRGAATAPVGYTAFCRANPAECRNHGPQRVAALTQERWDQLVGVNLSVNRAVEPMTDLDAYAREEVWTLPDAYGDCEDYVLLKRKTLADLGWGTTNLLVAVVFDEAGEGHAVLVVRTDRGDFVLDNKVDEVRRWDETAYRYVKRQSTRDPNLWVRISDTRWAEGASLEAR